MRILSIAVLMFLFCCLCAFTQEYMQNSRKAFRVVPVSVSGPPAIFQVKTNVATSGTSITTSIDSGTDGNRVLLAFVSWYPSTSTCLSNSFNGVQMTKITNSIWYDAGVDGVSELWGLVAPASGTYNHVAYFSAAVDELDLTVVALTNAAQSSTYNSPTNALPSTAFSTVTNFIATSVNELQLQHSTYANSPQDPSSVGTGQTIVTNIPVGSGLHSSSITTKSGTVTSTGYHTNTITWTVNWMGGLGVSIRGL